MYDDALRLYTLLQLTSADEICLDARSLESITVVRDATRRLTILKFEGSRRLQVFVYLNHLK